MKSLKEGYLRIYLSLLICLAVLLLMLSAASAILAQGINVDISGNGAGSNNQTNVQSSNKTNVNQSNQSNVDNSVDVNCNTGGNSASGNSQGGSIGTGNCSANVNISNNLNSNQADVSCPTCAKPSPSAGPSSTPSVPRGGNGGNGGGGNDGNGNGGGQAAAGPQVLGEAGVIKSLTSASLGFGLVLFGLWQAQNALLRKAKQA